MRPDLLSLLRDEKRLRTLAETELLDSAPEERFDRYTALTAKLMHAPTALISLVDDRRQFFKSQVGLGEPWASARETPLSHSLCKHVIHAGAPLVVEDAPRNALVRENLAVSELGVKAYVGMPLSVGDAQLGALCVVDEVPRKWSDEELNALRVLADAVNAEIELGMAKRELQERTSLLSAITESASDAIVTANAQGTLVFCNHAAEIVFGRSRAELMGRPLDELFPSRHREFGGAGFARMEAGELPHLAGGVVELCALREGREFPVELSLSRWEGTQGRRYYTGVLRDVTVRSRTEKALREAEAQLRLTFDNAAIGIGLVALDGRWLRVNDALCGLSGMSRDALLETTVQALSEPEEFEGELEQVGRLLRGEAASYRLEKHFLHRERLEVWVAASVALVRDQAGAPSFFVAQVQDITERKQLEAQLHQASLVDELTGLQNRRGFMLLGEQQLTQAARYGRPLVVVFADLNGMKQINDQLGHDVGDRALCDMAAVMRTTFRRADILARLGGDEFVVLAEGDLHFARSVKQRLEHDVDHHNRVLSRPYQLSVSLGVSLYEPKQAITLAALLARADELMYEDKRARRDSGRF